MIIIHILIVLIGDWYQLIVISQYYFHISTNDP